MPHVDLSPAAAPIRTQVREAVARAWERTVEAGTLPALDDPAAAPAIEIERPAKPEHGDFATNLAMKLARPLRRAPLQIAQALAAELASRRGSDRRARRPRRPASSTCAFGPTRWSRRSTAILAAPGRWGRIPPVRARAGGCRVRLGEPDRAADRRQRAGRVRRRPAQPCPRGRRPGGDTRVLLQRLGRPDPRSWVRRSPRSPAASPSRRTATTAGTCATSRRRCRPTCGNGRWPAMRRSMRSLGRWAAGASARASRPVTGPSGRPFRRLDDRGVAPRGRLGRAGGRAACATAAMSTSAMGRCGSASTAFGDDKDRVIYRADGRPTYFAADIGYVTEKFRRGFDHLIYIWGADHHGTVARVRDAAEAMGYPTRRTSRCRCTRWVRFIRDGVEVSMSKRTGEFITLDELLDEVGVDAARWFFASRAHTTAIDFDIELAKKQSGREPGLLRPVRPRPDRVDPAQGGRGRPRPGGVGGRGARRRTGGRARARDRPAARGRRGRGPRRGDPGRHGLRDGARDAVPAFYREAKVVDPDEPERSVAGWRWSIATQTTLAERPRPARDLRPRVDVARSRSALPGQPGSAGQAQDVRDLRLGIATRGHDDRRARGIALERIRERRRRRQPAARRPGRPARTRPRPHRCPRRYRARPPRRRSRPRGAPRDRRPSRPRRRIAVGGRRAADVDEPDIGLELAERVLDGLLPAVPPSRVARSLGKRHRDGGFLRQVLVGMEDLLGAIGQLRRTSRRPRASRRAACAAPTNARPACTGTGASPAGSRGILSRMACGLGIVACAGDLAQLCGGHVGLAPVGS